jgi:hypothetical protein
MAPSTTPPPQPDGPWNYIGLIFLGLGALAAGLIAGSRAERR